MEKSEKQRVKFNTSVSKPDITMVQQKNSNSSNKLQNEDDNKLSMTSRAQFKHMLQNAILMTEMGMDTRERCEQGEKYVAYLRSLTLKAGKNLSMLRLTSRQFLQQAQHLISGAMANIDMMPAVDAHCYGMKIEFERLLTIVEKELGEVYDYMDVTEHPSLMTNIIEKIKYLEAKQKISDNSFVQSSCSVRSVKSDVDEKYPENLSKDSLIDLNAVTNLPSVPEDIFTSFPNKPAKTSSLSSLKSMRRVKLHLQRAASNSTSEDEDSSELEDHHDYKVSVGDTEGERHSAGHRSTLKFLGNITEEAQD